MEKRSWDFYYFLAKAYFDHFGNLLITQKFITSDGYTYDATGVKLGAWINRQRILYKNHKLSIEKINLLNSIGMAWKTSNVDDERWNYMFLKAQDYFMKYKSLDMPYNFVTEDNERLAKWLNMQIATYLGTTGTSLSFRRIMLLESINIEWFNSNKDFKLQKEEINNTNKRRKRKEIRSRFISFLTRYDSSSLPNKEGLNKRFIYTLDNKNIK